MLHLVASAAFLLNVCSVEAFIDRQNGIHLFSLPELRSPLQRHLATGGAAWRNLKESSDGEYPTVHDAHEFVGATPHGYVVYNTSSILKSTTVQSDDYSALLSTAELTCTPRAVPAAHANQGHVTLSISFPAGVSDSEALEHLAKRLAKPEAVLVFGVDTLLHHPSLGDASSCATLVPKEPFFTVVTLQRLDSTLIMDVSPAMPPSVFHYLKFDLQHTPDIAQGVARRRAAGLYVGRELAVTYAKTASFGANWNGKTGVDAAATVPKLSLFDAPDDSVLYCQNCYFYLSATLNVNVQVCAIYIAGGYTYNLDASLPAAVVADGYGYYYTTTPGGKVGALDSAGKGFASATAAAAMTDCGAAGLAVPVPSSFNLGFGAKVWFEGSAGFNFAVKSDGISKALAFPTACTGSSAACATAQLPGVGPITVPTITVPLGGVALTIDAIVTLNGAGNTNLQMPKFKLQLGAAASVAIKLGGGVSFSGLNGNWLPSSIAKTAYSTFTATFQSLPFIMSDFTAASGGIDVTLAPSIAMQLWKFIPITAQPQTTFTNTLAVNKRALRGEESEEAARELGTTCASGTVTSTSAAAGALGVVLLPIKFLATVKTLTGYDASSVSSDSTIIPQTVLVDPTATSYAVTGAVDAAASGCVTVGTPVSSAGTLTPGGPGGGGSVSAGAAAAAAASDNSLSAGAIVGIVIGVLILVGLIAFGLWKYNAMTVAKSALTAGPKVASMPPAAVPANKPAA